MKHRKFAARLLAAIIVLVLPIGAQAKTWKTEDFTMEVPDGMYEFSVDTPADDASWALAGVADPALKLNEYLEMGALANFISQDKKLSILVMKKESDYSKQIYNFGELSEEEQMGVAERLSQNNSEQYEVKREIYREGEVPFFSIDISGTSFDGTFQHEIIYGTILNGAAYTFDVYNSSEKITEEQVSILQGMVSSVHFAEILPKPDVAFTSEELIQTAAVLLFLLAVIVAPFIYIPLKNRSDKKKKAQLARQLEEYRKTHGGDTVFGEMLFSNFTNCTQEAIRSFSIYHAYVKNIGSLLVTGVLCAGTLLLTFTMDSEWWMKLLAVGIAVYYGYKIFNTPSNIEKVQRKVYQRGSSSTAVYAFYEDSFRVSGVQSASVYPYFQITDVRKHGRYLYLYYGPDNAYLVDRNGFKVGEYEEFVKFLSERTGKK